MVLHVLCAEYGNNETAHKPLHRSHPQSFWDGVGRSRTSHHSVQLAYEDKLLSAHLLAVIAKHGLVQAGVSSSCHFSIMSKGTYRPIMSVAFAAGNNLHQDHALVSSEMVVEREALFAHSDMPQSAYLIAIHQEMFSGLFRLCIRLHKSESLHRGQLSVSQGKRFEAEHNHQDLPINRTLKSSKSGLSRPPSPRGIFIAAVSSVIW
jgi:hypothetical protein